MKIVSIEHHVLSLFVVVLFAFSVGCDRSTTDSNTESSTSTSRRDAVSGIVTLEIAEADGSRTITVPDVADGATLESVLRSAEGLNAVISGTGSTAFVNQIGDRDTSGSEGWTFTVDGKRADKGIGSTVLHPPATIQWKFGSMEDR